MSQSAQDPHSIGGASSSPPRQPCAACQQVFPQRMMTQVGERWICLLCRERVASEEHGIPSKRYRMTSHIPEYVKYGSVVAALALFWHFGLKLWLDLEHFSPEPSPSVVVARQLTEPWATRPAHEWPPLVAHAWAKFKTPLFVGSRQAFLVEDVRGKILALASVSVAQGSKVDPVEVTPERLRRELAQWQLELDDETLTFDQARPSGDAAFGEGVVVLELPAESMLPTTPLKLRPTRYSVGTRVYVVTRDEVGRQKVRQASVLDLHPPDESKTAAALRSGRSRRDVASSDGSATQLIFDDETRVGDLLGAPVLDENGLLMAIVTAPRADVGEDGRTAVFYAFGMDALRQTVNLPEPGHAFPVLGPK